MTIIYGTTEERNQVQFITTTERVNLLERQTRFSATCFRRVVAGWRCGRKGEQLSEEINSYTTRSWFGILKTYKRENGECKILQNWSRKMFISNRLAMLASSRRNDFFLSSDSLLIQVPKDINKILVLPKTQIIIKSLENSSKRRLTLKNIPRNFEAGMLDRCVNRQFGNFIYLLNCHRQWNLERWFDYKMLERF